MPPLNAPYEPTADMRQLAKMMRDMYQALLAEGFSDRQALSVLGEVVTASIRGQQK